MHVPTVAEEFLGAQPLDPVALILFTALFLSVAWMTAYRPAYGLCALIACQPFAFYRYVEHTTITLPKVALLAVVLGLAARTGAFAALRERMPRAILIAALAVSAATALSVIPAHDKAAALRQVAKNVEYIVLFVAAYACARAEWNERLVRGTVEAVTAIVAIAALTQEIAGAPSGLFVGTIPVPRIAGPLEGPNQLAGFSESAIAMLAAWICAGTPARTRWVLGLALAADVGTLSRAGWVGAAIALVTVIALRRDAARIVLAPVAGGVAAGFAIVSAVLAALHAAARGGLAALHLLTRSGASYAGGVGTRAELWRAAVAMARAHPLLGVGAGNYELELGAFGVSGVRTQANSLYLQALAEGGIVLFAATLALIAAVLATLGRRLRERPTLAIAAFAATCALATHQLVDDLFFYPKVAGWWWILIALGCAAPS